MARQPGNRRGLDDQLPRLAVDDLADKSGVGEDGGRHAIRRKAQRDAVTCPQVVAQPHLQL